MDALEGHITEQEIQEAIHDSSTCKPPGLDGEWLAADEAASLARSFGAGIGALPTLSPHRAHRSVYCLLGPSPVDLWCWRQPRPWRFCPTKASLGECIGCPGENNGKQDGSRSVCGGCWRDGRGTEARSRGGDLELKTATRGARWEC
ncbi:hypothetical protein NDU88_005336 [Pleurodeles waltl]|uniref:Uncharacterized protein n=1 Tax=Pleurodeles waltl TaxID=8319 RepID=A0AAV7NMI1_PLEWA|nr:hypothetical protein NDU88_005336 [Pleurodeles waltl]